MATKFYLYQSVLNRVFQEMIISPLAPFEKCALKEDDDIIRLLVRSNFIFF